MIEKQEKYDIEIKRLEKSDKEDKIRCYFSYPFGESYFDFSKKDVNKFLPGEEYHGVFSVSGMKDFLGDEEKEENICTWSSRLEKILDEGGRVIFENE